ncbi:DUF4240 domain-containing protein [Actinoplanes sp. CA-015351]|uniref:DUF4240 domain-containing protein n=1 Tax=Actinoplanes sp. CA-015351 TaxID=3239897 RepID=UPI003D967EB9
MDIDDFWRLIERSARESVDRPGREQWLIGALGALDRPDIEDFEIRLQELRDRIDDAHMWGAADVVIDGCSTDSFWYFQCWLVGQGRELFERVAADPDDLATVPDLQHLATRPYGTWTDEEWPEWESLAYVADQAYEAITGDEDALHEALTARGARIRSDPLKPDWSRPRRYPRLEALFPHRRRGTGVNPSP